MPKMMKIAFGTMSDTLYRYPGRISSDVENAKGAPTRAVVLSRKASERPESVALKYLAVKVKPLMGNLPWKARPASILSIHTGVGA
jgi:hypothetical protein